MEKENFKKQWYENFISIITEVLERVGRENQKEDIIKELAKEDASAKFILEKRSCFWYSKYKGLSKQKMGATHSL